MIQFLYQSLHGNKLNKLNIGNCDCDCEGRLIFREMCTKKEGKTQGRI